MILKRGQWPLLIVFLGLMAFFTAYFVIHKNYEFIMYVFVIFFFTGLILASNKKVNYPTYLLWLLLSWATLHMFGGLFYFKGVRLYDIMLISLSKTYPIFRYDQFVHIFGFFVATLVAYTILKPHLKPDPKKWFALGIVIVMAGTGFGALNEIIEFFATVILPRTGVGNLINLSLDLVANFIGAVLAFIFIWTKEKKKLI